MQRKKILWLVSWYPNKIDKYDGDFIQRHAKAAAIDNDIHVIHVRENDVEVTSEEFVNEVSGLTEQTIYYKKDRRFFNKILKQWTWRKSYKIAVNLYVENNGLPHFVHVHVPWKSGLIGLWMKKKFGTDYVLTEHWGIYNKASPDNFMSKPEMVQGFLKKIFSSAKIFVTVSDFLASDVQMITGRKCDLLIPNVVDTSLFHPGEKKYSRFTFIHVSNMVPLKNTEKILKAFKQLKDNDPVDNTQLILIGNRNNQYLEQARSLGLLNSSVFFRGEIPYQEVAAEMRRSHCFILFSDSETFSCVTAEALCAGIPVIASDTGALPELIDKTNGILVPPKDIKSLTAAMVKIYQQYSDFDSKKIATESAKKYSYSAVAAKFRFLYS